MPAPSRVHLRFSDKWLHSTHSCQLQKANVSGCEQKTGKRSETESEKWSLFCMMSEFGSNTPPFCPLLRPYWLTIKNESTPVSDHRNLSWHLTCWSNTLEIIEFCFKDYALYVCLLFSLLTLNVKEYVGYYFVLLGADDRDLGVSLDCRQCHTAGITAKLYRV